MTERQRLYFFHLEGLPDEVLLKIFSFLDIKGVLQCGQVSTRLRAISNDQSLWLKLNLSGSEVPFDFIAKAVENGCEYLDLGSSWVKEGKKSELPWNLKYLEISKYDYCDPELAREGLERVLQNCHFLQKLAVDDSILDSNEIEDICQNGNTLRILSLDKCNIGDPNIEYQNRTELIKKLFTSCPQLTELNISNSEGPIDPDIEELDNHILLDPHLCALVDNLSPNILKLNLCAQQCVNDKHVNTLVQRCQKITELDLSSTEITNASLESIIKNLNYLEKLNVESTNIEFSMILQLKSIPTLKTLRCQFYDENDEKIKNLKLQLPHISIDEEYLNIAHPKKDIFDDCQLWEITTKPFDWSNLNWTRIDSSSNSSSELGSDSSVEEFGHI